MELLKETKSFGLLAESQYGYVQGVKVGQTIFISGQLSHDEEGKHLQLLALYIERHMA
jgi:enamine deaminase RidA (YjgF/YER057c/UK114 family)